MQNEEQLKQMIGAAGQGMPQQLSIFQKILQAVAQAASIYSSERPGEALGQQIQQQLILPRLQEKENQRQKENLVFQQELGDLFAKRREGREQAATIEAEGRAKKIREEDFIRGRQEKLGDRMFELYKGDIEAANERQKAKEQREFLTTQQEVKNKQDMKEKIADNSVKLQLQGATAREAKEIASYLAGEGELTKSGEKALSLIRLKQERLQRMASGSGGKSDSIGNVQTLARLSDGSVIEMDKIKFNEFTNEPINLPKGITIVESFAVDKRGMKLGGQQPSVETQGQSMTTGQPTTVDPISPVKEHIQGLKNNGKSFGEALDEIWSSSILKSDPKLRSQAIRELQKIYGYVKEQPKKEEEKPKETKKLKPSFSVK